MLRKTLSLILALCLMLALAASAEIQSTDMLGRAHTLQAPASRVVALSAAECEILYALGAGSTLVGRGEYCDYPAGGGGGGGGGGSPACRRWAPERIPTLRRSWR